MADAPGVGDWVRCVDASCDALGRAVPLIHGEVYRITEVWSDLPHMTLGRMWSGMAFDLDGVPPIVDDAGNEYSYGAYRFAPLEPPEPVAAENKELVDV